MQLFIDSHVPVNERLPFSCRSPQPSEDILLVVVRWSIHLRYKLGYNKDDDRRGTKADVLLGDAEYVMKLP
jgi:hypothetical protein